MHEQHRGNDIARRVIHHADDPLTSDVIDPADPSKTPADLVPSATSPRDLPVELAFDDDGEAHQALSLPDCLGDHVFDGRGDGLEELVEDLLVRAIAHRGSVHLA